MIEEQALVVKVEGDFAFLETQRQSSCGHCSVKNSCGTQVLGKFLGNKVATLRCLNSLKAEVGERVVVGIEESALLKGSLLLYLLPILCMIFFAGLAVMLSQLAENRLASYTDLMAIIGAFSGLFIGLLYSKYSVKNTTSQIQFEPVMLRKIPL